MNAAVEIADAYRHCEAITRKQAANFFYGIRLLPRERRRAMCAAYAFARRVDDIGDGTLPREEKLRLLDHEAHALGAIAVAATGAAPAAVGIEAKASVDGGESGEDLVMVALADAQQRFALPVDALGELIEGVRMDVSSITYESFDDLVALLPPRSRRDRAGVPCDLRPARARRGPTLPRAPNARGRSRRGAAADEHPARRARGRPERSRLPARRRICAASA